MHNKTELTRERAFVWLTGQIDLKKIRENGGSCFVFKLTLAFINVHNCLVSEGLFVSNFFNL